MSEAASAPPVEPAPAPPPPAAPPRRPGALSAALAWLARRRWKALAVVLLLGLIGAGGYLIERHLRARSHLRAARAAAERYHNAEAAEHLEAYLKVWPRDPEALLLAARVARRRGALADADHHLTRYEEVRGPDDDLVLERVLLKAERGEADAVTPYCKARIDADDDTVPLIYEALARGFLGTNRPFDAEACLAQWLKRDPEDTEALLLRGMLHDMRSQSVDALALFRRALKLDPERDDVRTRLVELLVRLNQSEEPRRHLDYLLGRRPGDVHLRVLLARCQALAGDSEGAMATLDAVLADAPDDAPALAERGRLEMQARRPARAEAWLRKAVAREPADSETRNQLYNCLKQNGKDDEARREKARIDEIEKFLKEIYILRTDPREARDPEACYRAGIHAFQVGAYEEGRRWLHSAVAQDPGLAKAHAALAEFYRRAGNPALAARHRQLAQKGR